MKFEEVEKYTRMLPMPHQTASFNHLYGKSATAQFSDPGTGKTKVSIDMCCALALEGKIDAVVLFAWPNGIHRQWADEQIQKHWWASIPVKAWAHDGRAKFPAKAENAVNFFCYNIEATRSSKAMESLSTFLDNHGSKTILIIDESQTVKNPSTTAWSVTKDLGMKCAYRHIMTGTPIAKSIVDEWGQFRFLDDGIIGIEYKTAFQAQFCIMGGFKNSMVVGSRNIETFNQLIAPHTFRATKEELNLPPKMYDEIVFDLNKEQKTAQEQLRAFFEYEYSGLLEKFGEDAPVESLLKVVNVGSLLVKLQQISNGFIKTNEGEIIRFDQNPRIELLSDFLQIERDKVVIWCRFRTDIENVMKLLEGKAVAYYGATNPQEKDINKKAFMNDDRIRYFVANAASAGAGIDGLQTVCNTAVFYSQSYNLIERLQSEDRTNRIGTTGSSRYFDIVGRGSVDRGIIRNLKNKRTFSDMSLKQLKGIIDELAS